MGNDSFSFEGLVVYRHSKSLVKDIYALCRNFPHGEYNGLRSQLQRSIVSVASNIAEGSGRRSIKEKIRFLEIAYGSLMEAFCQLEISTELGYISEEDLKISKAKFLDISRQLNALSKKFQQEA